MSTNITTMRAAVYIRFSTDKQEDSPDRQRTTTGLATQSNRYVVVQEYVDEARRGWDDTRPGFRQLLADALAGRFDVIVVDECSRLSRSEPVEFFGEVVWPLKRAGVQLYSVAEGGLQDWNNLPGVLLSAVYQDRSAGESKKTAWRVTSNYLKLASEGRIDLGKPPYGYARVKHPDGRVTYVVDGENPSHAETVRFIFDAYANRDMSLRDIGRELERRGTPTPAGKRVWSQNCVGKILRDLKYAGYYVFNRKRQGKFYRLGPDGVEKAGELPTRSGMNDRDCWRVIPDHHEPLVPHALFERVQGLLRQNRTRTTPSPNRGEFLLGGLLVCGSCGGSMSGHREAKGKSASYRCTKAMATAQNHCRNNLVKEAEVLDHVLAALEGNFLSPEFLALCRKAAREMEEQTGGEKRVAALRGELATLEKDVLRARGRLAKVDDETFDFLTAQIAGWVARKKAIETELAQVNAPDIEQRLRKLFQQVEDELRNLRTSIRNKDQQLVRAAIRSIVASVEVGVERRLVGKRPRYFLVGGRVTLRTGELQGGSPRARSAPVTVPSEALLLTTRALGGEPGLPGGTATDNLSTAG